MTKLKSCPSCKSKALDEIEKYAYYFGKNTVSCRNDSFKLPKDANNNCLHLGEDVVDIQTGRKLITQAFELTSFHPSGDLVIRCYDPKKGDETLHHPDKLALLANNNKFTTYSLQNQKTTK